MSRIVFLTPVMPSQAGNGLAMRAGLFLEGLSRSHDVDVVVVPVFGRGQPIMSPLRELAASVRELDVDPEPDIAADYSRRLATASGRARAQALHPRPTLCRTATLAGAEEVAELARGAAAVHIFRLYLAPYLDVLLDRRQRPAVVLDVDDIESLAHHRLGQAEEARRFERLERHYLPIVDRVVTASTVDAARLVGRLGLASVTTVPNAVPIPAWPGAGGTPSDLLFVGNLSYAPNTEGAFWLCHEVLPLLGDIRVVLVGTHPPPAMLALAADPRVQVLADVPEVGPFYAATRVAVVPLHAGGGTRIKVLEAFAHGRPVVATSLGAEGLAPPGGDLPVIVADSAGGFAAECRSLLDDPARAGALGAAGRERVRDSHTVDVVAATIDQLVCHTLSA